MRRFLHSLVLILFLASLAYPKCGVPTTPRGDKARQQFARMTGYPHGRKGYVIDHIFPLCKGGKDDPSNMQWQTVKEAKAKDKWECRCDLHPITRPVSPSHDSVAAP